MSTHNAFVPYKSRSIAFRGIRKVRGYSIKEYSILYGEHPLDLNLFEDGFALAEQSLPEPAVAAGRPGLGFIIAHQGRTGNYVVLCWWDRENELPTRVFIHDNGAWRVAKESESFCVWDLQAIWHERETYITTMLSGKPANTGEYLSRHL